MSSTPICPHCGSKLPHSVSSQTGASKTEPSGSETRPRSGSAAIPPASLAEVETVLDETPDPSSVLDLELDPRLTSESASPRAPGPSGSVPSGPKSKRRRRSWSQTLLVSYASAITIACVWLWWTGHRRAGPADAPPAAIPERRSSRSGLGAGLRADRSAVVEPSVPIPDDNLVPLGGTLQIHDLEIEPTSIDVDRVRLIRRRPDGKIERRDGGERALLLRLRLRNTSEQFVFAPLDEAFLRQPDRGLPEAFLEFNNGDRIYAYPLPVNSEWAVAGQEFVELRPGEAMTGLIVTAADATRQLQSHSGPCVWRILLRTSAESFAVVGVTFELEELLDALPNSKETGAKAGKSTCAIERRRTRADCGFAFASVPE